jgi:hypothetical protein
VRICGSEADGWHQLHAQRSSRHELAACHIYRAAGQAATFVVAYMCAPAPQASWNIEPTCCSVRPSPRAALVPRLLWT